MNRPPFFTSLDLVFLISALLGGILFLLRLVLQFLGTDHGADVHTDLAADHDISGHDSGMKLLSFQGMTGFFLMFGLVGLSLSMQSPAGPILSILGAFAAGFLTLVLIGYITFMMTHLQSSGTVDTREAVGQEGSVYLTIPTGGTGKVQLTIHDRMRFYDAVSEGHESLKTGERVQVVRVTGGNVMVVKKAISYQS
ncbi:MAG: NfeD family protein [bacterium]|nr:NfeD family protein [bacterium]